MGDTSPGCYFLKASNNTFHDLTAGASLPPATATLLGLSLKFIPTPCYLPSKSDVVPSLDRFECNIDLKTFFTGHSNDEEIPKPRAKSAWRPPLPPMSVNILVNSFLKNLKRLFCWRQGKQNLTPHQQQLLASLQANKSIIIANADKNLGPVGIEVERYIKLGLDHLLDLLTYELLAEDQAEDNVITLKAAIHAWTVRHHCSLSNDTINFIKEHLDKATKDPLGHFYLLIKLHKLPISGRPVCSDCGSLPLALGCWVDATLQPIVQDQALYFKNSAELKTNLEG
jgi:hypothetical protein